MGNMPDVSFMDNENQMVIDATLSEIGDQLFENWHNSNLDECILYADYQIALMCDSNYLKRRYNEHWELTPDEEFYVEFDEEETGWGGEAEFLRGKVISESTYENKCRDCDEINTMEYCDNDCGEICSSCNYMGEADLECVKECQTHKIYLDSEHVPDYRMEQING